jgi:hypothetical protein
MIKANRLSKFKLVKNLGDNTISMLWFDKGSSVTLWTWPLAEWTYVISNPHTIEAPEPVVEPVGDEHLLGLA